MRITTIPAFNPSAMTGQGNNTYLVGDGDCALIDAGVGDPRHLDAIADALAARSGRLSRVLVTHAHIDHIGGVTAIAARWPNATFAKIPWSGRDDAYAVRWTPLADDEHVSSGGADLAVVHTPGHAPDHACFWSAADRVLFCGDLVTPGTTVVIPGTRGGDLSAYLSSLARVRALDATTLLPGHGDPVSDPAAIIDAYVAHRRERDEQIVAAVSAGHGTVAEIIARVYPTLAAELRWAAEETIVAHLQKLVREGRVAARDDRWTPPPTYT